MDVQPTILISDDDPLLVAAFKRMATRVGLHVVADSSSADQLMLVAKLTQPAVIVLDIHQPVDGRVLLARLKRDPETSGIRVIVLTGSDDALMRRMCLKLGAREVHLKPFDQSFVLHIAQLARMDAA